MVLQVVDVGEANEPRAAACNLDVHGRECGVGQQVVIEKLLREIWKRPKK